MLCESVRPLIRTFLDDLLDEKDYQSIQTHFDGCERCRAYASSVGTLCYRLYELGQVSVPPDMVSTVLYELEKQSYGVPVESAASWPEEKSAANRSAIFARLIWPAVLLILAVAVAAVVTAVSLPRLQKTGRITVTKPIFAPASVSSEVTVLTPALGEKKLAETLTHWHYHLSSSSQSELEQIFQNLDLTVLDGSQSHLVFDVPKGKLGEFTSRITELSGVLKEYGEMDPSTVNTDTIQVSIYLE